MRQRAGSRREFTQRRYRCAALRRHRAAIVRLSCAGVRSRTARQRSGRVRCRRRRIVARGVARSAGPSFGQRRVQSAGTMWLLHGARRRSAARVVRDAGAPCRRTRRDHHRRAARRRSPRVGRRVLRGRRESVRLLHARDHHAPARVCARSRPTPTTRPLATRCSRISAVAPVGAASSWPRGRIRRGGRVGGRAARFRPSRGEGRARRRIAPAGGARGRAR